MSDLQAFKTFSVDFQTRLTDDPELYFKTLARRARLLGLWAAEKMFLYGDKATRYAMFYAAAEMRLEEDIPDFEKLKSDLTAAEIAFTESELFTVAMEKTLEGEKQVLSEPRDFPE